MENYFTVKQELDTGSVCITSTSKENVKLENETEGALVTAEADGNEHTDRRAYVIDVAGESCLVKNETFDIKESPEYDHFEESIDTGNFQHEVAGSVHNLSLNENYYSEPELDLEERKIDEKFVSSDSEYVPSETYGSNPGSSTSSDFSINDSFRESFQGKRNIAIFRSIEPIIEHNSPVEQSFEHVDPIIKYAIPSVQPSTQDHPSQYQKKDPRKTERLTICPLCCDDVPNHFSRHLFRAHKDHKDIIALQKLEPRSKERLDYIRTLRKRGNFVMKTERNISMPMKHSSNPDTKYFVCTFCLGYYAKTRLFHHVKRCQSKPKEITNAGKKCLQESQTFMASLVAQNEDFLKQSRLREVFVLMRADDISYAAKSDPLACLYGEALLNKQKRKRIGTVVSNRMREIGRLLIALRTANKEIGSLFDALKPHHFRSLLEATKVICGYQSTEKCFAALSLARLMGTSLRFLCDLSLEIVQENRKIPNLQWTDRDEKISEINDLKKLIESNWGVEISRLALKPFKERHRKRYLNDAIQLFHEFVNNEAEKAFSGLKTNSNIKSNYKILIKCVLAVTLMFNRKNGGIQYLTVEKYESNMDVDSLVMDSFTDVEKLICRKFKKVVTGGKGFQPVPILFSKKLQQFIDILLEVRRSNDIVPKTNPYLFAYPDSQKGWISGANILKKFAQKCGAKDPSLLTSARFRKHVATTLQLMNMEDDEMEQISTFMGHTEKTYSEFHRFSQEIHQTAKLAKVLLLLEKGKGKEYIGKNLNEIVLDEDVYVTTESEGSDNDEDSACKNFLERISKQKTVVDVQHEKFELPESEGYNGEDSACKNFLKRISREKTGADEQPERFELPGTEEENCTELETRTFDDRTKDCPVSKFKMKRRKVSVNSDDEEDSSGPRKKLEKLEMRGRRRWSEKEKNLVTAYFKEHIQKKIPPKKHECEKFLSLHKEVFIDKCWTRVKTFVYNTYRMQ